MKKSINTVHMETSAIPSCWLVGRGPVHGDNQSLVLKKSRLKHIFTHYAWRVVFKQLYGTEGGVALHTYTCIYVHDGWPVKMTQFFGELPQASMKCTASPHRREGWPVNTTQGVWYTLPRPPWMLGKCLSRPLLMNCTYKRKHHMTQESTLEHTHVWTMSQMW